MSIDQEYKDFSKWCRDNPAYDLDPRLHTHSGRINDGGYILHKRTGTAFKAWQASRQGLEGKPAMWSLSFNGGPANHFTTYPTKGSAEDYIALCRISEKESKKESIEVVPLYTHPASAQPVSVPEPVAPSSNEMSAEFIENWKNGLPLDGNEAIWCWVGWQQAMAVSVPEAEYTRALQDAFDIIQADANTEENYGSLCRIGSVLAKIKAGQEKSQ